MNEMERDYITNNPAIGRSWDEFEQKYFTPEEMVGKEVVVVANLKPATLGGVLSEGMILFAENSDGLATVEPGKPMGGGSTVS